MRGLTLYFAVIITLCAVMEARTGWSVREIALGSFHKACLAAVPLGLIALYAWGIERSTTYTITSRRVVIGFGIAVPVTFNIPFARIHGAGLHKNADGSGDLPLQLSANDKMSYLVMWPHARPWRMARTEPMLRGIPQVEQVAAILARALAVHAAAQAAVGMVAGERAVLHGDHVQAGSPRPGLAVAAE